MQKTKEISQQNQYLVTRVSLMDTVKNIPAGVSVKFDCRVVGSFGTATSCVSRLNRAMGHKVYSIASEDNGVTYTITHNKE